MHACKRVHDKLWCTRLEKYTILYTNMAAITKRIAKNNKTTTSASKTTWHFGDFTFTSFVYRFTKLHDRRITIRIRKSNIPWVDSFYSHAVRSAVCCGVLRLSTLPGLFADNYWASGSDTCWRRVQLGPAYLLRIPQTDVIVIVFAQMLTYYQNGDTR